jgi:hypothetical protein
VADLPKPADFFIGISEFFGSLAPGTVLVAVLWRLGTVPGFSNEPRDLLGFEGAALVAALIIAGYLAGNLASVLGAMLDTSYDSVRKLQHPHAGDKAYQAAKLLRDQDLGADPPMNVFQWARAVLAMEEREAFDEVTRYEAASKLFRTMVVVSLAVSVAAALRSQLDASLAAVGAAVLSCWPYVDRRYKSTETAYRLVIVLQKRRAGNAIKPEQ